MPTIGSGSTGYTFTISGSFGDVASSGYTVPSPGIYVNQIQVYASNNGSSSTDRLYIWADSSGIPGGWLARSGTFNMGGWGWQARSDIAFNTARTKPDGYFPPGWVIHIGIYSSTGILAVQGSGSGGPTRLGNTSDGNWSDHGNASGIGQLAATAGYVFAAPHIESLSATQGAVGDSVVITGYAFNGATSVKFNGVSASFTIDSNTQITATVPAGASTGPITVTNAYGTGTSPTFTVYALWVYSGSAWAQGPIQAWDSAAWQQSQSESWSGSAWQNTI